MRIKWGLPLCFGSFFLVVFLILTGSAVSGGRDSKSVKMSSAGSGALMSFGSCKGDFRDMRDCGNSPGGNKTAAGGVCPELTSPAKLVYPPEMRRLAREGRVVIEAGVSPEGRVVYGQVLESPHRDFSLAVIHWLKEEARFRPGREEKVRPVTAKILLRFHFRFKD